MISINLIKFYLNYMGLKYELLQIETTNKIRLTNFSEDCKKSNQNTLRSLETRHVVERIYSKQPIMNSVQAFHQPNITNPTYSQRLPSRFTSVLICHWSQN